MILTLFSRRTHLLPFLLPTPKRNILEKDLENLKEIETERGTETGAETETVEIETATETGIETAITEEETRIGIEGIETDTEIGIETIIATDGAAVAAEAALLLLAPPLLVRWRADSQTPLPHPLPLLQNSALLLLLLLLLLLPL